MWVPTVLSSAICYLYDFAWLNINFMRIQLANACKAFLEHVLNVTCDLLNAIRPDWQLGSCPWFQNSAPRPGQCVPWWVIHDDILPCGSESRNCFSFPIAQPPSLSWPCCPRSCIRSDFRWPPPCPRASNQLWAHSCSLALFMSYYVPAHHVTGEFQQSGNNSNGSTRGQLIHIEEKCIVGSH